MNKKDEKGSIMVEAAIYIPMVLSVVMALLYLAIFNLQEYSMMYQAQRIGVAVSREEAYKGYSSLGIGNNNQIDFDWGDGGGPSDGAIKEYYKSHYETLVDLYGRQHADTSRFNNSFKSALFLATGAISNPEVEVRKGFFGATVTVDIKHTIPIPGVLKYIGYKGGNELKISSYTYAVNPSDFVRNVDLAGEIVEIVFDKLNLDYGKFIEKSNKLLDIIL